MAFKDCIHSARDQGVLSDEEADDLIRRYEAHRANARGTEDPRGPEGVAQDLLARDLKDEAARKERVAQLAADKIDDIKAYLEEYRDEKGRSDVLRAALALLENRNNELAGTASVVGRRDALTGYAHGRLEQGLYEFRRRWLSGKRMNLARLDNAVGEAFSENTGDMAARGFLSSWRRVADDLVDRFNEAGGAIKKMESYFPQRHDARRLMAAGQQAWVDFIRPRLDLSMMEDPLLGGPLSPERLNEGLGVIWRRIVTDGAIDLAPSRQVKGRGALANQRQEERFLQFKDAAAWREYAEAFGSTDVYAVMMDHIHGLAKDVAALEVLGPNPNATVEWLRQVVQSEGAKARVGEASLFNGMPGSTAAGRLDVRDERIANMWNVVNGSVGTGNMVAADVMEASRNWLAAANLGGTAVTAVLGDPAQSAWARRFAGIPALRWLAEVPRQVLSSSSRRDVARAGIIMEDALEHLETNFRGLSWAARSKEVSRYLPDRVFAWTGLTPWDRTNRRANAFGFMFEAGDRAPQTLAEIRADGVAGERFARQLEGFGISDGEWDEIRIAGGADHGEAGQMLRPIDIVDILPGDPQLFDLAMRYSEAVHAFIEEAVPHGTARVRSVIGGQTKKGTLVGELVRQPLSYLAYPASMMLSLARATSLEIAAGGLGRGAGFLASAMLGMTLSGAMILQVRNLRQGRDLEAINTPAFWARAFAQGGALGFYGDWLLADYQRGGADVMARAAGPVGGLAADTLSAIDVLGMAKRLGDPAEKDINRTSRVVGLGRKYVPGQTMWWVRPVTDRLLWDRLQILADPKAARAFAQKQRDLMRSSGQGTWWPRGQAAPARLPDFSLMR